MMALKHKEKAKYTRFPFATCDNEHLKDTTGIIRHGINLTIQFGLLDFEDFDAVNDDDDDKDTNNDNDGAPSSRLPKNRVATTASSEEDDCSTDEDDSLMEYDYGYDHVPPSPILVPTELPKSSFRKGSFGRRDSGDGSIRDMSLSLCRAKLEHMINEYFPLEVINDDRIYVHIKHYIINSIIQNEGNIDQFLTRIVNHRFKNELSDVVKSIFIEKYEELKLEELIDRFYAFLNCKTTPTQALLAKVVNPGLYDKYYKIWRLDAKDFAYYDEEYFFDYFNNGGKSATSIEHLILQNGFLINYKRFVFYFTRDIASYCDDSEDDDDEDEGEGEASASFDSDLDKTLDFSVEHIEEVSNSISLDPLTHTPKSLRFNDEIDIININRYLPVDHVLYKHIIEDIARNN
ncbi:uncharacterized protein LODBEIA_P34370 [Lodderomyces beijingensis]|uniref:Uncharacterized protein n=1 Tax=Lodderomyces beijingensis TaxID=1775926 RepID=A0ABP0ZNF8_9ASCO